MNKIKLARVWILGAPIALVFSACALHSSKKTSAADPPAPAAVSAPTKPMPAAQARQDSAPETPGVSGKTLPALRLWAVVQSVDLDAHELVVKDKGGRLHTLSVSSDAAITRGGINKAVELADIKVGDRLTLKVSGKTARSVHVNVLASR